MGLAVVALSIVVASALGLRELGVPIAGEVPAGLPSLEVPALRLRDVEGIVPLAAGCLLLAYIESDLSASPHIDLAGARMLHQLHLDLARRGVALRIVGARGRVRHLLRAEGIGEKVGRTRPPPDAG
jgi:MFS superfamily sulfate permease-like transporter